MLTFIIKRVLWTLPVLVVATFLSFSLVKAMPNSVPFDNPRLSKAAQDNLRRIHGLDQSFAQQYLAYLDDLASVPPEFGYSIRPGSPPVTEQFTGISGEWSKGPLLTSFWLGFFAFWFALIVGTLLGIIAALRANTWVDGVSLMLSTLLFAIPLFVVARYWVDHLPYHWTAPQGTEWGERWGPIVVLGAGILPYFTRLVRASMLETLQAEFVTAARSKGLPWRRTVARHVVRNSLIPMVTNAGPLFGFVVTGSFIVERVMNIPGIGVLYINGFAGDVDTRLVLALVVLISAVIIVVNMLVDIAVAWLDPRIVND